MKEPLSVIIYCKLDYWSFIDLVAEKITKCQKSNNHSTQIINILYQEGMGINLRNYSLFSIKLNFFSQTIHKINF